MADSQGAQLRLRLAEHPSHTCLTVEDGFTILGILPGQQTQANQKRLREALESLGYQSAKVILPDGRQINRLTRQIG